MSSKGSKLPKIEIKEKTKSVNVKFPESLYSSLEIFCQYFEKETGTRPENIGGMVVAITKQYLEANSGFKKFQAPKKTKEVKE